MRSCPRGASRTVRTILCALMIALAGVAPRALAQDEPEAPKRPVVLTNGFQLSFFAGPSLNVFSGGYSAVNNNSFIAQTSSWSMPAGFGLSIPMWSDAALYLRAGWTPTQTSFFAGKIDSLHSTVGVGEIGDEFAFTYSMVQLDLLFRLIGKMDGERIIIGPSFGFVRKKHARVIETEYPTGAQYLIEDGDIAGALATRVSIIIGAEYAWTPVKNLYLIPSIQIDYCPSNLSTEQPMKFTMYKFLVSVAWQVF
jgi:hypothetical protein